MNLIQLTMNHQPLILDVSSIVVFHEDEGSTWIELKNGTVLTVEETVKEVCRLLVFDFKEEEVDL